MIHKKPTAKAAEEKYWKMFEFYCDIIITNVYFVGKTENISINEFQLWKKITFIIINNF